MKFFGFTLYQHIWRYRRAVFAILVSASMILVGCSKRKAGLPRINSWGEVDEHSGPESESSGN